MGLIKPLLAYLQFTGFFSYRMAITILVVTICCLPWRPKFTNSVRDALGKFAQKRALAILVTGVLSFIVTSTLALRRGVPVAYVHDEFSYLLAADTYAHGRLTNPAHPLWPWFETFHVLSQPTYFFFVEHRPWRYRWDEVPQRLALERRFSSQPGQHLLLVRYLDSHNPHFEWVQNGADIDAGKIVWAHDEADNAPPRRYFAGRDVWRVTVGDRAAALARLR